MPTISGVIQFEGCLVDVALGWSKKQAAGLRAALRPVPPAIQLRALIDPGAEVSCTLPSLVQALGLPLTTAVPANMPAAGGLTVGGMYAASLTILHSSGDPLSNLVLSDHQVLALDLGVLGYEALIGRDVLALCRFLYDGPAGRFELGY